MQTWTLRLIALNVIAFLLMMTLPGFADALVLVPGLAPVRPWTLVTYMFLHGSFGHLFFNMLSLFFFGPRLEARLGGSRFLTLYLISGLAGALLSFMTPSAAIVGASGATFGVLYGFAHYWPRDRIFIWGVFPIEARWLVGIMTVLALFGTRGFGSPGIAHFAHLGGFLGGFLYLRWLDRSSSARRFQTAASRIEPLLDERRALERWSRIRGEDLHEVNRAELDRLRHKIETAGVGSLTSGDREFLDRFSAR